MISAISPRQKWQKLWQKYFLPCFSPSCGRNTFLPGRKPTLLGGIRQTPGYLQKQPCHLPKETGVQLLCAASYDIWCRDMDTDQTSTEQTCGRTDKNGKKYAQHHIQRQKDQHLGQGEDKSHRYNQHCKKNEMVLGRAYQPPQRRPMDLACHQLETI